MVDSPPYRRALVDKITDNLFQLTDSWMRWIDAVYQVISRAQLYDVEYFSQPSATGFSVSIPANIGVLILDPIAAYANGTIVLPTQPTNRQRIEICSSQNVTAVTWTSSYVVKNAPAGLTAGQGVAWMFRAASNTWYRLY